MDGMGGVGDLGARRGGAESGLPPIAVLKPYGGMPRVLAVTPGRPGGRRVMCGHVRSCEAM
jgi:hypothetical protein